MEAKDCQVGMKVVPRNRQDKQPYDRLFIGVLCKIVAIYNPTHAWIEREAANQKGDQITWPLDALDPAPEAPGDRDTTNLPDAPSAEPRDLNAFLAETTTKYHRMLTTLAGTGDRAERIAEEFIRKMPRRLKSEENFVACVRTISCDAAKVIAAMPAEAQRVAELEGDRERLRLQANKMARAHSEMMDQRDAALAEIDSLRDRAQRDEEQRQQWQDNYNQISIWLWEERLRRISAEARERLAHLSGFNAGMDWMCHKKLDSEKSWAEYQATRNAEAPPAPAMPAEVPPAASATPRGTEAIDLCRKTDVLIGSGEVVLGLNQAQKDALFADIDGLIEQIEDAKVEAGIAHGCAKDASDNCDRALELWEKEKARADAAEARERQAFEWAIGRGGPIKSEYTLYRDMAWREYQATRAGDAEAPPAPAGDESTAAPENQPS